MLVSNVVFRLGGSACLLSTRQSDRREAKYVLDHCLRTVSTDDEGIECLCLKLDQSERLGVHLPPGQQLQRVLIRALDEIITKVAARVANL